MWTRRSWVKAVLTAPLAGLAGRAGALPVPEAPANPDQYVRMADAWARQESSRENGEVGPKDLPYIRFVSFWDVPDKDLWDYRRYFQWLVWQLTFERFVPEYLPREVPGAQGRLVWLDLRWYGWNERAWEAVAKRCPFTTEPQLTFEACDSLRKTLDIKEVVLKDRKPCIGMVNGWHLIRDLIETRRAPSYYDLLFARFRFPGEGEQQWRYEKKTVYHSGGDYRYPDDSGRIVPGVKAGTYTVELKHKVAGKVPGFVDFPKNVDEWDRAFGLDVVKAFSKGLKRDRDWGVIVPGGRDFPEPGDQGSQVALNNRLLVFQTDAEGRLAMRSFDTFETTGLKNYSETLIFKGQPFKKGQGAQAEADGGELLYYLPGGGQAGFLINAKGERVEVAVGDVANDRVDKRLNQGVRNVGSCITCHGPGNGYIVPRNLEDEYRKLGIKRKFKDKEQEKRYYQFFADYTEDMEGYTRPFARLVRLTTAHPHPKLGDAKTLVPWTGATVAAMTGKIRDAYDAPVDAERAARTVGLEVGLLKFLCVRSPAHMPKVLVRGGKVPSRTWEVDMVPEIGRLLDLYRSKPAWQKAYGEVRP